MKGMWLSKGTLSLPTEGSATSKLTTGSSAATSGIQSAHLSRNQFQIAFDREPVKQIAVLFSATDPVYAEVRRVLQIMIPGINIS